jgi:hypothetical protein
VNRKAFFGALVALSGILPAPVAAVTTFFSAGPTCGGASSATFSPGGSPIQVSVCVTTTTEKVCGATLQLEAANAGENDRFRVTGRALPGTYSDPNTVSLPSSVSITNPRQTTDFGGTVTSSTPPAAGANQLLATFTLAPQASATNNSYVIGLSTLSAIATETTNCFGSPTDTPISATFTLNKSGGAVVKAKRFDLNGDGKSDVFWRNMGGGGTGDNYVWPMSGTTVLGTEGATRSLSDLNWVVAGIGDFDGDGKVDILWRNAGTFAMYIWPMNSTAVLGTEGFTRTVADANWQVAGVGDFDGDGRDDVLWHNNATGANYVWLMNGTTISGEGALRTLPSNWQLGAIGDFDGDGKSDILWRNSTTGQNYIWPMSGTTVLGTEGYTRTIGDTNWQIKAVGDFNGDGKTDLLWRNSSSGDNYIWPMSGTTVLGTEGYTRSLHPSYNWDIASCGDFDGDGKFDVLWRNTSTGQVYLWPMNGTIVLGTEGVVRTVPVGNWTILSK